MFRIRQANGSIANVFVILELIFPIIAKDLHKSHISPHTTLLMKMLQSVDFTFAFFLMFQLVVFRDVQLRGDFLLFIIISVFYNRY